MIIFKDTFTNSDGVQIDSHTGDNGATWTPVTPWASYKAEIYDNRCIASAANSNWATYIADGSMPNNYEVSMDFHCKSIPSGLREAFLLRCPNISSTNFYRIGITSGSSSLYYTIYKYVNGSGLFLGNTFSNAIPLVSSGDTIKGSVKVEGNVLSFTLGGVDQGSYTDTNSPILTGNPGFMTVGASATTGWHLDNFIVDNLLSYQFISAFCPSINRIFSSIQNSNKINVINPIDRSISHSINVNYLPVKIIYSPSSNRLYSHNPNETSVIVVNPENLSCRYIDVGFSVTSLVYLPHNGRVAAISSSGDIAMMT